MCEGYCASPRCVWLRCVASPRLECRSAMPKHQKPPVAC